MTGILPIKKDGSQSAISDFREYTMLFPWKFAPYVGFTEEEVRVLCEGNDVSFDEMKHWYDGYSFPEVGSVYNPNSVMKALQYHCFDSYWTESSASESLMGYINLNYDGLLKIVTDLIGGTSVPVLTTGFANDLKTFRDRNDVLTLLIHLGYLAYDSKTKTARIPNEEIRMEFSRAIRTTRKDETIRRLLESDKLIEDIIHMDEDTVAAQIEKKAAKERRSKRMSVFFFMTSAFYTVDQFPVETLGSLTHGNLSVENAFIMSFAASVKHTVVGSLYVQIVSRLLSSKATSSDTALPEE